MKKTFIAVMVVGLVLFNTVAYSSNKETTTKIFRSMFIGASLAAGGALIVGGVIGTLENVFENRNNLFNTCEMAVGGALVGLGLHIFEFFVEKH